MNPALLEYLACPRCLGTLRCETVRAEEAEVIDGTLSCTACGTTFPVRAGVLRTLPQTLTPPEEATARAFGTESTILSQLSDVFQISLCLDGARSVLGSQLRISPNPGSTTGTEAVGLVLSSGRDERKSPWFRSFGWTHVSRSPMNVRGPNLPRMSAA